MDPLTPPWLRLCFGPPIGRFLRAPMWKRAWFAVVTSCSPSLLLWLEIDNTNETHTHADVVTNNSQLTQEKQPQQNYNYKSLRILLAILVQ